MFRLCQITMFLCQDFVKKLNVMSRSSQVDFNVMSRLSQEIECYDKIKSGN